MRNAPGLLLSSALLLSVSLPACKAQVGSNRAPSDTGTQCKVQCEAIGMELSQVALMAGEVGCICDLPRQPGKMSHVPHQGAGASTVIMTHDRSQAKTYERSAR